MDKNNIFAAASSTAKKLNQDEVDDGFKSTVNMASRVLSMSKINGTARSVASITPIDKLVNRDSAMNIDNGDRES